MIKKRILDANTVVTTILLYLGNVQKSSLSEIWQYQHIDNDDIYAVKEYIQVNKKIDTNTANRNILRTHFLEKLT